MISQLTGILDSIETNNIVVDVSGVGYKVNVPTSILGRLPKIGDSLKIFTYQVVREDANELYGFLRKEERHLFSILLSVSGIGPKMAIGLMSGIKMEDLVVAITRGNVDLLTSVPGIGLKTAQRLIIELKEKVAKAYSVAGGDIARGMPDENPLIADALSALITLGYSPKEAREAVRRSGVDATKAKNVEEIIKRSLKVLG